jgi:hypothetical protein
MNGSGNGKCSQQIEREICITCTQDLALERITYFKLISVVKDIVQTELFNDNNLLAKPKKLSAYFQKLGLPLLLHKI